MKNIKRYSVLLLMIVVLMGFSACKSKTSAPADNSQNTKQEEVQSDGTITEDAAKKIVKDKLSGSTDSDFISFEKELDDGVWKYEGKISNNGQIYEFEINATDGKLLEWEVDD